MILKRLEHKADYCRLAKPLIGVFGSEEWLNIYEDLCVIGIYKDEKQLIGGFYYLVDKKFGLSFLKLPPYSPHCGLVFTSDSKNPASRNGFVKEVITQVAGYIASQKPSLSVLAFPSSVTDMQPFIWNQHKVVPNYTYRVDLTRSLDAIKADFDPKHRNAINKALSEGLDVEANGLSREELYAFFSQSLEEAKANVYTKELKNIFLGFAKPTNSFSFVAKKEGQVLGAVFCVYDQTSCYYLLGGVKRNSKVQGVNNLLVLKSLTKAKENGCTIFDFEGSMLQGVEKFFRGFGGELVPYFTANKGLLPVEMVLKFKKRERF